MERKGVLLLILIVSLILVAPFTAKSEEKKVDGEVYNQLEENNEINVVVKVKEETGFFIFKETTEKVIGLEIDKEELKKLERNKKVEEISFAPQIKAFLQDSVDIVNATSTWGLQINDINITGIDETICIIDSGINFSHPDLQDKNKTCIIDCYNKDCIENCSVGDDNGHGTHVAGIVAASSGIQGIAKGASLIGIKVLDEDGDAHSQNGSINIRDAIDWCVQNREEYNISIISLSLGTLSLYTDYCDSSFSLTLTKAINNATLYNISVITATGNNGDTTAIASPACIENSTAVGAIRKDDATLGYNRNNITDLIAPGYSINSTRGPDNCVTNCECLGNYMICSGTSMATPQVSGAFALIRQYFRLQNSTILKPIEIQNSLNGTGKIIYDSESGLNFSRIDVHSAIRSFDEVTPEVNLVFPENNSISYSRNKTFRCNATDQLGLKNLTLQVWNSTSLYYENTTNIDGNFFAAEWNITLNYGDYEWNCLAYDLNSNPKEAINYSFNINRGIKMILIGVDGFQYNHYVDMLKNNQLGNFTRLMENSGFNTTISITGHSNISTAPGNAELHSGLNETLTNITDDGCDKSIPEGNSTFERLKNYNSSITTGSIYGKTTCYVPNGVLGNSLGEINWWHNRSTYSPTAWSDGTNCDDSEDVAEKATEFIENYSNSSFYLVIYFGVPDCSGHEAGDNSINYNNSFINVDEGLGIILDSLENNDLSRDTQIIVTTDHGWNEASTEHSITDENTTVIPIITNNLTLIKSTTSDGIREQCEIAPTILDHFGVQQEDYQEIIDNGCGSMIYRDYGVPNLTINSPSSTTFSSSTILFNVSIDEEGYCEYSLNSGTTNHTMNIEGSLNFYNNNSLSNGDYTANFYCNDTGGNKNYSETVSFTVSVASQPSSRGGGGGGGLPRTYTITQQQSNEGYSVELIKDEKLKLSLGKEEHIVTVKRILNNSIILTIKSEPIETILLIGEEKKLDITNDTFYDLYIKLNSLKDNKANLTIKTINEKEEENLEKAAPDNKTLEEMGMAEEKGGSDLKEKNLKLVNYILIGLRLTMIIVMIIVITFVLIKRKENEEIKTKPQRKKKVLINPRKGYQ